MGKNTNKTSLGRALFKSRFSKAAFKNNEADKWLHTSEIADGTDWNRLKNKHLYHDGSEWDKLNLKSVTEQNSLDDFLNTAELAGKDFESERLNLKFVNPKASVGLLNSEEIKKIKIVQEKNSDLLRIPRRPLWKGAELDSRELHLKEREAFLEWRRNLACAQENEALSMTPFEKNLEFWRQLWRVIERSDVVVQIVDARNPLLFCCKDLEKYVKEVNENKINLLLINKSDFLTERQRLEWLRYFEKNNIKVAFWSAAISSQVNELHKIDEIDSDDESTDNDEDKTAEEEKDGNTDDSDTEESISSKINKFNLLAEKDDENDESKSENDDQGSDEDNASSGSDSTAEESTDENENTTERKETPENTETQTDVVSTENLEIEDIKETALLEITDEERLKCKILTREELIDLFKTVHKHIVDKAKPGCTTIGLVGYPNVGKSSTLNALLKNKRVAVSETPGKTKHYQTIFIDDELLLCDCPGLVFPSFVTTKGELILNGILPIDQMRDYNEPISLVIQHLTKSVLEMFYGIVIQKPKEHENPNRMPTAEELCTSYSLYRGYMNHKGMPDVQRGARVILKDYVNGKLLYCYPPPGIEAALFQDHRYEPSKEIKYLEKVKKSQQLLNLKKEKPELSNFDREFFYSLESKAHTKGGIVGYHRQNKAIQPGSELGSKNLVVEQRAEDKAWKKHFGPKRREKLRRMHRDLDQHDY